MGVVKNFTRNFLASISIVALFVSPVAAANLELDGYLTVGGGIQSPQVIASSGAPSVSAEKITALTTVGAATLTAANIAGGVTSRGGTQTGAFTDTTDTAANIIAALPSIAVGQAFEYTYQNNSSYAATISGGTNVTVSGLSVVQPNSYARYLVTYVSATSVTLAAIAAGPNVVQATQAVVATADSGATQTLTAAMVTGGNQVFHTSAGGSTPSLTMPLATAIIAAIPNWQIGQSYVLRVINTNSGTATIVTNTGITTTGTLTLATNTTRDFVITMTGAATITMVSAGTGTTS
jgi:hypothetical protein